MTDAQSSIPYLMCQYVHIGHSIKNTIFTSSFFVLALRLGIFIIDLFQTVLALKKSILILSSLLFYLAPIWFVDNNIVNRPLVHSLALRAGEFSPVKSWINGAVSNFFFVYKSWRRSKILPSKDNSTILPKQSFFDQWWATRFQWPRAVFFTNVKDSKTPVKECAGALLPVLGVVDTDTDYSDVRIVIPGNDESTSSVFFFSNLVSEFILKRKFNQVLLWFFYYKNSRRILAFDQWLNYGFNNKRSYFNNNVNALFFSNSILNYFTKTRKLIVSFSYWKDFMYDALDLFSSQKISVKIISSYFYNLVRFGTRFINLNVGLFLNKILKRLSFVKKKIWILKTFKKIYLKTWALKWLFLKRKYLRFKNWSLKKNFFNSYLKGLRYNYIRLLKLSLKKKNYLRPNVNYISSSFFLFLEKLHYKKLKKKVRNSRYNKRKRFANNFSYSYFSNIVDILFLTRYKFYINEKFFISSMVLKKFNFINHIFSSNLKYFLKYSSLPNPNLSHTVLQKPFLKFIKLSTKKSIKQKEDFLSYNAINKILRWSFKFHHVDLFSNNYIRSFYFLYWWQISWNKFNRIYFYNDSNKRV